MTTQAIFATRTIPASADDVFAVLADPASHAAIDGTGWVREPRDAEQLTRPGQVFRMGMYHADHPEGGYTIANQVRAFEQPTVISWAPGTEDGEGRLDFGGWIWRYDLAPVADGRTAVRLTYDWSGATLHAREVIEFPPFGVEHLQRSLRHLTLLVVA